MYFGEKSKSCRRNLVIFFEGWDVSRATTCLISMLILITIHIQEFSNRILPLWNGDKNCADQLPALVEVSVCF